jgi:uncharacterized protein
MSTFLPKREEFFAMLTSQTDRLVAGANAAMRLVNGLGNPTGGADQANALIDEVNSNATSAGRIKEDFIQLLFEAFQTPISSNLLHTLALDLDRVMGKLQNVADAISIYHIADPTSEGRAMAALAADTCVRLNKVVVAFGDRKHDPEEVAKLNNEIVDAATKAGQAMSAGVTRLFAKEGDDDATLHALKMNRFYFAQYDVLNACKRAAQGIEEILLETA